MSLRGTGVPWQSRRGCVKGFVSPHLPTEIASSLALLAKTERYAEYYSGLERMLQPTQLRSQRQGGYAEIASSPALLAKTVGVNVGLLPIDYSLCHNLDIGLIKVKASGGER